jgi:hypothetical protein
MLLGLNLLLWDLNLLFRALNLPSNLTILMAELQMKSCLQIHKSLQWSKALDFLIGHMLSS